MNAAGRILIIEDDPAIAMTLRRVLTGEGHEIAVETRGDSGLERAGRETFDLILADLKLPGLSGLDLVRALHPGRPRLPIIVMTAHGTTETAIQATQCGANNDGKKQEVLGLAPPGRYTWIFTLTT